MGTIRVFRQYIPISYMVLALFEVAIFIISLYLGVLFSLSATYVEVLDYYEALAPEALLFATVMLLSFASVGLYQRRLKEGRCATCLRIIVGVVIGVLIINQLSYTIPDLDMGHSVWLTVIAFAFIGAVMLRMVFFKALEGSVLSRRILVLGAKDRANELKKRLPSLSNQAYVFKGFIPFETYTKPGSMGMPDFPTESLLAWVQKAQVDEIVIAIDSKQKSLPTEALLQCKLYGISVTDIVSFYERETGKIMIDCISPSWFIFADGFQRGPWSKGIKRISDLVLSSLLSLFALPAILVVACAIWLEGGGRSPVLFRQKRVGENGKVFELLKFRSMCVDAEKDGPQWAKTNDSRVTKIGRFIRKTRLDELPQLINVFKGEMSFVGPRPERPEFVGALAKDIPFYLERHVVKPGITGWAQVCYPYGSSIEDAYQKLQYDLYYVKNYSLFLDFVILLQTLEVVVWRKGAR